MRADLAMVVVQTEAIDSHQWLELDRHLVDAGWLPVEGMPAYCLRLPFMTQDDVLVTLAEKAAGDAAELAGIENWDAVVVVGDAPADL